MRDLGEAGREEASPIGDRVSPFGYRCQMGGEGAGGLRLAATVFGFRPERLRIDTVSPLSVNLESTI